MITRDRSFPHPVLAPFRDDVSPNEFAFTLNVNNDADNFYIGVAFTCSNDSLAAVISGGKAAYAVHVECKRNFFRELHRFKLPQGNLTVRTVDLVGRIEVCGFVVATAAMEGYRIGGSHPDYGTAGFTVQPGDILAAATTVQFDAYVDYDPLRQISSILTVQKSEDVVDGPMLLDTSGERLIATLSQNDYDRYADLKADPRLAPLVANQIVVPALMEAVNEIKSTSDEEYEDGMRKRWFRSIDKKLKDGGTDIRTASTTALGAVQYLVQRPLRRSLEGLVSLTALEDGP